MDSGPAEVVQLPASSPDDHGADVSWTAHDRRRRIGRAHGRGTSLRRRGVLASNEPVASGGARAVRRRRARRAVVLHRRPRQVDRLQGRPRERAGRGEVQGDARAAWRVARARTSSCRSRPRRPTARRSRRLPTRTLPVLSPRTSRRATRTAPCASVAPAGMAMGRASPAATPTAASSEGAPRDHARSARPARARHQAQRRVQPAPHPRRQVRRLAKLGSAGRCVDAQGSPPRARRRK